MRKIIKTKGMHCPSCERIIEKAALSVEGVKSVKSDFTKEETTIEFDENITNLDDITYVINTKGYECETVDVAQDSLLFLLGLFWIIKYSFSFSFPEITPGMGLAIVFTIGILTSFHCVGMCGGFVLSYTTKEAMNKEQTKKSKFLSHLKYGTGKTITYVILGAMFGLLGSFVAFTPKFKGIAALVAGLFLVIYGLNMLNVFPWLRKLQWRGPKFLSKVNADAVKGNKGPFVIGLLNGLMIACGPLQAMLIYSAGTASVIQGALAMFVFGLGTLPLMLGFGSLATILGSRFTHRVLKVSALIVIIMGVVMVNRGLTLTGTGYDFNTLITSVSASGNEITGAAVGVDTILKDGYQEIRMEVNRYGWKPDKFVLKKGVPVRWVIDGKEINGCNNAIQVPKLGLDFDIRRGEQVIEFTPTKEGKISWSCWMGMIPGVFIVKDDIDLSNTAEIQKELDSVPQQQRGSCGGSCGSSTCGAKTGGGCGCGGGR
jgi:sulfite exporter TauE/SafE/copper chaperone CopZ